MAHHLSAKKRIRQNEARRVNNRYFARTTRNAIKELRNTKKKKDAEEMLPKVSSMIDRMAKKHIIHRNKAANLKSKLSHHVNSL
jgi:small subunit ribosomal protein S20